MQGFPISLFAAVRTRTRSVFTFGKTKTTWVILWSKLVSTPAGCGVDRSDHGLMKYCKDRVSNTLPAFGLSVCD